MFETLERAERGVPRRWPLVMYSIFGLLGLEIIILRVHRHGFSQPASLAIACVMFLLSLTWLITAVRSDAPLTNRKFSLRNVVLIVLLMALQAIPLFHQ
jgi:hypothetical protein